MQHSVVTFYSTKYNRRRPVNQEKSIPENVAVGRSKIEQLKQLIPKGGYS